MSDELDRLASEGRALRERQEAAKETDEATRRREDAAARRIRHASLSAYAGWGWVLGSIAAGIAVAYLLYPWLPPSWSHEGSDGDPATLVLLLAMCVPAPFFWALRPIFGRRAEASEEARVRALPFPLTGYLEALGRDPREWTVRLALRFRAAPPDRDLLADALRTVGAEVTWERDGSPSAEHTFSFETSPSTNGFLAAWVRRVLPVLVALHARHPLARVELAVS